jgi:hypothetical protein
MTNFTKFFQLCVCFIALIYMPGLDLLADDLPRIEIRQGAEELLNALEQMPFASEGKGTPLYVFEFSECPFCQQFNRDYPGPVAGIEMRHMFYAVSQRSANEAAALAQSRSIDDYRKYMAGNKQAPNFQRSNASIDAYNKIMEPMSDTVIRIMQANGWRNRSLVSPQFFFVEDGVLIAQGGYTPQALGKVVASIAASEPTPQSAARVATTGAGLAGAQSAAKPIGGKVTTNFPNLSRGSSYVYRNAADVEAVMSRVDNALWAADGDASAKQIYVIYSPTCAWSKKLYEDTRDISRDIQIRWIPHGGTGAAQVALQRDGYSVHKAFMGQLADTGNNKGLEFNQKTTTAIFDYIGTDNKQNLTYPTVIYESAAGLAVYTGNPSDLYAVVADIKPRPAMANYEPKGLELINAEIKILPVRGEGSYANTTSSALMVMDYPLDGGSQISDLPPDNLVKMRGVTENGWVAVLPYTNNTVGYIYDPQYVKLSQMQFTVVRARGEFVADTKNYPIRSHPDATAPVVSTLDQGYVLKMSGRVKDWVQVVYLSNGGKGYIFDPQ